jgi:hypothetical protein
MRNYIVYDFIVIYYMSDTTSLNQLPPPQQQNITLNTQENPPVVQNIPEQHTVNGDQNVQQPTMFSSDNQMDFIKNINQAAQTGATQLPSRDIPKDTNHVTIDPNVKLNYIENRNEEDYIGNYDTEENIVKNIKTDKKTLDRAFEEFQVPIIIIILFFIFQMPLFNTYLLKFIPKLFDDSGSLKIHGYLFKSLLFGFVFYMITKSSDMFINKMT